MCHGSIHCYLLEATLLSVDGKKMSKAVLLKKGKIKKGKKSVSFIFAYFNQLYITVQFLKKENAR